MAVGDFTITSGSVRSAGNVFRASGTVEAGTTAATAAIFPNGYIVSFSIDHNVDGIATAVPMVHTNSSDLFAFRPRLRPANRGVSLSWLTPFLTRSPMLRVRLLA